MSTVPAQRIEKKNSASVNDGGDFVLYWMTTARRFHDNFALDRAIEWSTRLQKPLVILEALRVDYPWASDRIHRFVVEGMRDNVGRVPENVALYYPYVEPTNGAGKGLLEALGKRAAVVVTDAFPCFFIPRMIKGVAEKLPVLLEEVDSNGLLPMSAVPELMSSAHGFRRFLQRELPKHLPNTPNPEPLVGNDKLVNPLPLLSKLADVFSRWPRATAESLADPDAVVSKLPIDHSVRPVNVHGGSKCAAKALVAFLSDRLAKYASDRNQPDEIVTSGLSPYLHFGHTSVHTVFRELAKAERWSPANLHPRPKGARAGWWGMSEASESFLDEAVTWRELGFNMCARRPDYDSFDSLPDWARNTLDRHTADVREHIYDLRTFENAKTHDDLWNASQNQLVREGRIHNYVRMLWGKKIVEWTANPRDALRIMIELNNKYALDGRNPNSYSGIFWVLGRYDRPWAPERPIFGAVRYMSSANTKRKLRVKNYLARFAPEAMAAQPA